ncbi:MAG TPA: TolC family protein [bacterium]|jgi:outer membrane protein TolC
MGKKSTQIALLLAAIIQVAGIVPVWAEPLSLSFQEAWELAQKGNAQIQSAQIGLEKAEAQIGEAWSAALPNLTASAYYQRNFIIQEIPVELPEEMGGPQKFKFQQENLTTGSVTLTQPLYAAGRVGLALQIAKLYHQNAEAQIAVSRAQTKMDVTRLYFGAALAQEWEKVAAQTYAQMQDHLKQVEAMNREGLVSEYDLIRSRVQVSNFYPQVVNSQSAKKTAFEALNIVLGLPKNQELELTDGLAAFNPETPGQGNLYDLAMQGRGEIRQLGLQAGMLRKLKTIEAHGVWWPNLALVGGYSVQAQEPDFDFNEYYWSENLYAGLSLTIPLFDGFKASHRVQQVKADLKLLGLQREQLEKVINLEIIQAKSRHEEAQKNVEAQVKGVELARKGLQIAETRYANGLATQLEVMDAQVALNQAQMNELNARYELITASAELQKAIGRE